MEIGGIERSLLALLSAFDYDKYDVDLFLQSHTGCLLGQLDPRCNLLPESFVCASQTMPISSLVRSGHFILAAERIAAKIFGKIHGWNGNKAEFGLLQSYMRSAVRHVPEFTKEYDVVLSFRWPHDIGALKVKANKKIAWIHTDYSSAQMNFRRDEKIWNMFDYIAAVSDDCANSFAGVFPSLAGKLVTIENLLSPQSVRSEAEAFVPPEYEGVGQKILSVGRICNAKAFDLAAESLKIMLDSGCNVKWFIVGVGPDEQSVRQKARELGVEDSFVLLGKRLNPYPYMKHCDVYAQPSRYEGKAVTVREAQILGKPVLITDFATARSQVEYGVDAVVVQQGVENVAKGLTELLGNAEKRGELSKNCLERDYSNSSYLGRLYELMGDCSRE